MQAERRLRRGLPAGHTGSLPGQQLRSADWPMRPAARQGRGAVQRRRPVYPGRRLRPRSVRVRAEHLRVPDPQRLRRQGRRGSVQWRVVLRPERCQAGLQAQPGRQGLLSQEQPDALSARHLRAEHRQVRPAAGQDRHTLRRRPAVYRQGRVRRRQVRRAGAELRRRRRLHTRRLRRRQGLRTQARQLCGRQRLHRGHLQRQDRRLRLRRRSHGQRHLQRRRQRLHRQRPLPGRRLQGRPRGRVQPGYGSL